MERKRGDWDCPKCGGWVFASKNVCKCGGTKNMEKVQKPYVFKQGDWKCPSCGDNVFASKNICRCGQHRVAQNTNQNTNQNNESVLCTFCYTNQRNVLMKKCGHISICNICLDKLNDNRCPICRTPFTNADTELVYIS